MQTATDGHAALQSFRDFQPDLVLLDIRLPVIDGLDVLRQLRNASDVYVILLTAKSEEADVIGLGLGADDYVTKPFSPREVVARIKAALRRLSGVGSRRELLSARLRIDEEARLAWKEGRPLDLTPIEFDLLLTLMRNHGRALSREQLIEQVWGYDERVQVTGEDELAELAHSFNRMAGQLAETETRRRQLIGDVAHELRTPLSSIQSVMEGLQDGIMPPDAQTFASVGKEVSRLQRLVRDLEDLSRAEAGQIVLQKEPVDPTELVTSAANRLRPQFADKGVTLETDVAAGLPTVLVDAVRVTQVLLNLLGNALQYTPPGGRVFVRLRAERDAWLVTVEDNGIGIREEEVPHIFERFYRVDKSRSRAGGGSGVELTISKHLVEAHGGRLTASSPGVGHGSTFTVALPR